MSYCVAPTRTAASSATLAVQQSFRPSVRRLCFLSFLTSEQSRTINVGCFLSSSFYRPKVLV
uniref:Uncharacterized protein n=1 Tax=Daphnia magna TaxID=35525 RepID=A0A0P6H9K9_9CRUS